MLVWTRVPRRGFVPSHWIAKRSDGREVSIWQHVEKYGRHGPRIVTAILIPPHKSFPNVAAAKVAAEN